MFRFNFRLQCCEFTAQTTLDRCVHPNFIQCAQRGFDGFIWSCLLMQQNRLKNLIANCVHRIQAGHRLLKNHRDLTATNFQHLALRKCQQIASTKENRSAINSAWRTRNQLHRRHRSYALATTRFTNDCKSLSRMNGQTQARNGLNARTSTSIVERDGKICYLQQWFGNFQGWRCRSVSIHQCAALRSLGSIASRSAPPSTLYARTEKKIAAPGKIASHHTKVPVIPVALESSLPHDA